MMSGGCNLRCAYCATDFGRFGRKTGVMSLATARRLADRIVAGADPRQPKVKISFGGGETFLHFNRFLQIADLILARCARSGVQASLDVGTNGVLLNEARLQQLARRRIHLTFSIDGPGHIHDAVRNSGRGRGSFAVALAHWKRYREITRELDPVPGCMIHSVYGFHTGALRELAGFWVDQGVPLQDIALQTPSRFAAVPGRPRARRLNARFLAGLREWALEQARTCTPENFLGAYRGPTSIYAGWKRLMFGQERPLCSPGVHTLAVDRDGAIYPCDGYVGIASRRLGDVFTGVDPRRQAAFAALCAKAKAICAACHDRLACEKPCLAAAAAAATPAYNVRRQCRTMAAAAGLIRESFAVLMQKTQPQVANA